MYKFHMNNLVSPLSPGLTAELFYVRNGQINEYALNFVVPVPATITDLHFTWQSLTRKPLPYTLHVDVTDPQNAMHPPTVNISNEGFVPTEPQTWRVDLPCTHTVAAEVDIVIFLNVSTGSSSSALRFRRKKICLKEAPRPAVRVDSVPHAPTFAVMAYCWAMSPDDRPTLPQLQIFLRDFHTQLTRFV
ncbi:hypothetical protein HW555_001325 [Spodoptera exigua]|uniref:WIF domain-containing protein n=1 Tax=Spodoptera exigua TaxID=7107 RepID=A0A835GTD1_SPOEX|nr:hypothetical protein HW555_001325 [Spodoptera exigua]